MRNLFKAAAYSVLLVMLGAALVVTAPAGMVTAGETKTEPVVMVSAVGVVGSVGGPGFLGSEVHQQAYLTYLVNEFAPGTMGDWSAAFAERKKVVAEFPGKGVFVKRVGNGEGGGITYRVDEMTPEKLKLSVPEASAVKKGFVIKFDGKEVKTFELKDGEVPELPTVEKGAATDVFIQKAGPLTPEQVAEMKAKQELYKSFEQAVESKDATKLKEMMPKILDDYKLITQKISQANEEMKKNQ